jgi:hypothetical protein
MVLEEYHDASAMREVKLYVIIFYHFNMIIMLPFNIAFLWSVQHLPRKKLYVEAHMVPHSRVVPHQCDTVRYSVLFLILRRAVLTMKNHSWKTPLKSSYSAMSAT